MANHFHRSDGKFGTPIEERESKAGWEKGYDMGRQHGILEAAEHYFKQGIAAGVNMAARAISISAEKMWDIIKSRGSR